MTDTPASTGVIVPALYIGQADYVLTFDEHAEPFDITASVDGRPIITGHGFRGPAMGTDPRDSPADLVGMFGAFLAHEIERAEFIDHYPHTGEDSDPFDAWTIHDSDADLSSLADACSLYGDEDSAC